MSSGDQKSDRSWPSVAARYLSGAESAVLAAVGVVLVVVALMLLANSVIHVYHDTPLFLSPPSDLIGDAPNKGPEASDTAVKILNTILLVMMTMEIVYTVAISLESHTLVAEPFLIIGAISAIRRMLVITAMSTKEPLEQQRTTLLELTLLALTVIAMAFAIWMLKKSSMMQAAVAAKSTHAGPTGASDTGGSSAGRGA